MNAFVAIVFIIIFSTASFCGGYYTAKEDIILKEERIEMIIRAYMMTQKLERHDNIIDIKGLAQTIYRAQNKN